MEPDNEISTALRKAARTGGYDGADALAWRTLLSDAADEIDRLRTLVPRDRIPPK